MSHILIHLKYVRQRQPVFHLQHKTQFRNPPRAAPLIHKNSTIQAMNHRKFPAIIRPPPPNFPDCTLSFGQVNYHLI